jgi:hypothetical protein
MVIVVGGRKLLCPLSSVAKGVAAKNDFNKVTFVWPTVPDGPLTVMFKPFPLTK